MRLQSSMVRFSSRPEKNPLPPLPPLTCIGVCMSKNLLARRLRENLGDRIHRLVFTHE
ncbi:predicted protein [Botrytis cinerea T4]|uniref:Uncharacterized protein n=1 Tax=Botryotinia fuckeliana (strain T4) TaxID=999810 RepID=G2YGY5_BOTF4|nr:predicted protein [Botrytis cinerea T4]